MELEGPESTNIEDRRGDGSGFGGMGGGFGGGGFGGFGYGGGGFGLPIPLPLFRGGFGIVAFIILMIVLNGGAGGLLDSITGANSGSVPAQTRSATRSTASDPETQFVARVLGSTESVWGSYFQQMGQHYVPPRLVLYRGATQTQCGRGSAAMGPFYCPPDQRVYIDLSFFDELAQRFHAPGQFPQAYVIAHEVGHHVQNLLGISGKVAQLSSQMSRRDANALSVRTELQADCLAGVWAYHAEHDQGRLKLTDGDVEQAITAATSIGDDRLQQQAQGRVVPDSFTHGTSEQRVRWLERGLQTGDIKSCDTFRAQQL
ncbi:MAG TPA: neutral zinc metallopeptidase [Reyranella sp.]|jgi:predicted metalloprotease|nr:neutral zinc metallopeptidase [Reyranella sp.]